MYLSCGQCQSCRLATARDWSIRGTHELATAPRRDGVPKAAFLTLTFDDEHLPSDRGLDVRHWQLFAKRLRKQFGPFRFMHCGEYGEKNKRPHYHAIVYGLDFMADRIPWKTTSKGTTWISDAVSKAWQNQGFITVGNVTWQSISYVARYVMKKRTGTASEQEYARTDPAFYGLTWNVRPDYMTCSRRPGLGTKWIEEFHKDVYPADEVVIEGKKFRPPRFYDDWMEKEFPNVMEEVRAKRIKRAQQSHKEQFTYEECAKRAEVVAQRMENSTRPLEE